MHDVRKHIKRGNKKIGKDTLIFNMCPATDCPAKALGLCQLSNTNYCYALHAEKMFPTVLPYRRRQAEIWENQTVELRHAISDLAVAKPTKYVRYNESGDFRTQNDVDKLALMAYLLPDLVVYGYTARKDLCFAGRPKNLIINGSGWSRGKMNKFLAVRKPSGNNPVCPGDCSICGLCKSEKGITVEIPMHGGGFNRPNKRGQL